MIFMLVNMTAILSSSDAMDKPSKYKYVDG